MQLLTLLILVVPFYGAVEATPRNSQRQTTTCGLKAADTGAKIIQTAPDTSLAHCTTSCAKNSACLAYAFGYGYCRLYSAPVAVVAKPNPASQAVLYDKACRMPICGLNGNDKGASILQTTPAGTLSQCASNCAGIPRCGSYRFASGSCRLSISGTHDFDDDFKDQHNDYPSYYFDNSGQHYVQPTEPYYYIGKSDFNILVNVVNHPKILVDDDLGQPTFDKHFKR
ncbi:unnamed protein product [Zymoseptoria tritici ST99CH_3D7]|uniref:Apple domain-containing protein n=1 Tax=Zymoseptoria tritici (strain ST99CH_3D7) TaxID=1276538 RepID=A0A1X7RUL5_ZYMT9|nr:unnamed protein product [Zymoseptoria tritici ST99CH_3D7]